MLKEWEEDLSIGNEKLDEQHKRIIEDLNKLIKEISEKGTGVKETAKKIEEDIKQHSADEEKYMNENNFPGLEVHKKIHEQFLKNFLDFEKELEGTEIEKLAEKAEEVVGKMWVNHIEKVDSQYCEFIKNKQ